MISFLLTDCKECSSVEALEKKLDEKISSLSTKQYNQASYLAKHSIPKQESYVLLFYKEILNHIKWNPDFYKEFDKKEIVSRVKSLI